MCTVLPLPRALPLSVIVLSRGYIEGWWLPSAAGASAGTASASTAGAAASSAAGAAAGVRG